MSETYDGKKALEIWTKLYDRIGKIATAANHDHWMLFEALRIVLKLDREDASGFFYSLRTDSAQRDFCKAVIGPKLIAINEHDLLKRLNVEISELGKLAGVRNAFIHTPWSMSGYDLTVTNGAIPHPKLDLSDPLAQADKLISDFWDLSSRLEIICDDLEQIPSLDIPVG